MACWIRHSPGFLCCFVLLSPSAFPTPRFPFRLWQALFFLPGGSHCLHPWSSDKSSIWQEQPLNGERKLPSWEYVLGPSKHTSSSFIIAFLLRLAEPTGGARWWLKLWERKELNFILLLMAGPCWHTLYAMLFRKLRFGWQALHCLPGPSITRNLTDQQSLLSWKIPYILPGGVWQLQQLVSS